MSLLERFSLDFSFISRHLDSSSNERPDISSIQRRIKVSKWDLGENMQSLSGFHISHFIQRLTHSQCTDIFLNELTVLFFDLESNSWHGHVLWDDGKLVSQWLPANPFCQSGDALCWSLCRIFHQPAVLPIQLPLQSCPCIGELMQL